MHLAVKILSRALIAASVYEGSIQLKENAERHHYWSLARAYSDLARKPLLVVGMKRHWFQPPNGDITVDIDHEVESIAGGIRADERALPFRDKEFGAVYNAHTLEHLATPEDVELAVNECLRVGDIALFLAPSPYSIIANFFCPSHHLRLWLDNVTNEIVCKPRNFQTGLGFHSGRVLTGQAMLSYTPIRVPSIIYE